MGRGVEEGGVREGGAEYASVATSIRCNVYPGGAPSRPLTSKVHQSRQIITMEGMATRTYTPHSAKLSLDHPNHVFLPGSCWELKYTR